MKKTLSIALSLVMLISSFAISGVNVFAATISAPEYKFGETFVVSYDSTKENDYVYYAKFVAPETRYYEFTLDKGLTKPTKAEIETYIFDSKGEEVMWNFADEDFLAPPSVAAKMTKGQAYYFALAAENCGTYTTNVTISNHTHKYEEITFPAMSYQEYEYFEDGGVITGCETCGYMEITETYYYAKTVSLSKSSYTYDGKAKKPTVTVKDRKGSKIAASHFKVKYSKNKSVGTATATVTFNDKKYSGQLTKTFKINPKGTSLSSVTAKSKGFTVKWKKQATQTTGYQIQYATNSKFTKNKKTVTVSKNKTTSKTISKLKGKKKYYVRIRTYKTVSGKKYYSGWSKAKTVTTKK